MTTPYTTFQPVPYDTDLCSLGKCPIEYAMLSYLPTVTGNSVYIALFGILLALQTFLGLRYRTWGVLIGTTCCFLLEIIGYIGRIIMHSNPFPLGNFLL